jgi:hypothetical protein
MKFCTRCVLPETFPGISFDSDGVCSYCSSGPTYDEEAKNAALAKFVGMVEQKRSVGPFDVILAYSGGKDSTHTLSLLRERYGLRVLAFVFDNGFMSAQAMKNIAHMTGTLGASCLVFRPPFSHMKKAFSLAARHEIYSPKTLDRASSICTTCIGMVKAMVLKTALAYRIPMAAFGWSPGQAPLSSSLMQTSPRMQAFSDRSVRDPLLAIAGNDLKPYFLDKADLAADPSHWPVNVHPLAFMEYDEEAIMKKIQAMGWVMPDDTDPNSTNCLLNALANHIHRTRFGFHPYAWEVAGIVRSGCMERDFGLEKTTQEEDPRMVSYAADMLGVDVGG